MEKSKIIEAKKEAQRFIKRVDELLKRHEEEKENRCKRNDCYFIKSLGLNYTKESGTVRRASMDLTRILAEMRSSK